VLSTEKSTRSWTGHSPATATPYGPSHASAGRAVTAHQAPRDPSGPTRRTRPANPPDPGARAADAAPKGVNVLVRPTPVGLTRHSERPVAGEPPLGLTRHASPSSAALGWMDV
jgi:hypothetical protein